MSDDIVMRLRASSLAWRIALMPEAADEIDRLRSALDIAIRERNEARAEVKRLRAENARLRAQIVEYFREPGTHEVERLTRQRDEARAEVERLRDEDTKTRHALRGWVWVCPDGGDEPTHERVSAVVAEVERLTRERDEARDIDDCLKSVRSLTRDRGEVMRAGNYKIEEIRARHEEGVRAGADEDRAWLLAEVERLRQEMIGLWARVAKARPEAESEEP